MQRTSSIESEPEAADGRRGTAQRALESDADDGDREIGVAHRVNPLPLREEDEEELSEADIMEELDMAEVGDEDLAKTGA